VLPKYRDQALDALERTDVPPGDRKLVTDYFDKLAGTKPANDNTDKTNSATAGGTKP
jgi:hypothetical protein